MYYNYLNSIYIPNIVIIAFMDKELYLLKNTNIRLTKRILKNIFYSQTNLLD